MFYDEGLVVQAQWIGLRALVQPAEEVVESFTGSRGYSGLVLVCLPRVFEVVKPLGVSVACGNRSYLGDVLVHDSVVYH